MATLSRNAGTPEVAARRSRRQASWVDSLGRPLARPAMEQVAQNPVKASWESGICLQYSGRRLPAGVIILE